MKRLKLKVALGSALFMSLASCTKNEDKIAVFNETITPNVVDAGAPSKLTAITRQRNRELAQDTTSVDSTEMIGCYRWDSEYYATTRVRNDVDNSEYDMNVMITLQPTNDDRIYTGGILLYVDEENFVEAYVEGQAEGNHITIFYVEDEENTTGDLFSEHDKLALFELSEGEYSASWYKPMHRFVNETTVISIR